MQTREACLDYWQGKEGLAQCSHGHVGRRVKRSWGQRGRGCGMSSQGDGQGCCTPDTRMAAIEWKADDHRSPVEGVDCVGAESVPQCRVT